MAYIGNDLQVAYPTYRNIDDISGSFNSSATSFPLLINGVAPVPPPLNSQQCLISVGGVVQRPDDSGTEGFRLSGGNIIFASAPTTGADFFGIILAGADYVNAGGTFPSGSASVPSITFNDDVDTGIYNSGPNQLSFSTSGVERLRIDSAGQIEAGSLGTAAVPAFSFLNDVNTGIYSPGADQVAISTGGTGRLFIDSSGRVGIGTASLAYALDVVSSDTGSGYVQRLRHNATANAAVIQFTDSNATTQYGAIANDSSSNLRFITSLTEKARIDSSGRLLVGTSTDSGGALLQVNGDRIRVGTAKTPASATATGTAGEICWDASYVYVCTATNTWKRSALSTW